MNIIIGNLLKSVSSLLFLYSLTKTNKRERIYWQLWDCFVSLPAFLFLGAAGGFFTILLSFSRNVFIFKKGDSITQKQKINLFILILLFFVLFSFKSLSVDGPKAFLPFFASVSYSFSITFFKSMKVIRFTGIANCLLWGAYSLAVKDFVGFGFSVFLVIVETKELIKLCFSHKKEKKIIL